MLIERRTMKCELRKTSPKRTSTSNQRTTNRSVEGIGRREAQLINVEVSLFRYFARVTLHIRDLLALLFLSLHCVCPPQPLLSITIIRHKLKSAMEFRYKFRK